MLPRIIWSLWLQGWNNAPPIVAACAASWRTHNAGWQHCQMTMANLPDCVMSSPQVRSAIARRVPPAALSDVIRIEVLRSHGGVWVDGTTYCLRPLDGWIDDAVSSGFFAFDRPAPDRMVASWFLAGVPGSYIVAAWWELVASYWHDRTVPHQYFWFHELFADAYHHDPLFRAAWDGVPKQSADGPHCFDPYDRHLQLPPDHRRRQIVERAAVPLLKLSHKVDHGWARTDSAYRWLCERASRAGADG